jgi:hypothetical protein
MHHLSPSFHYYKIPHHHTRHFVPALDVGVATLLLRVRDHTSLEPRDEVSVDDPAVVVTLALKLSLALGPDSGGVGVAVGGPNFLIK